MENTFTLNVEFKGKKYSLNLTKNADYKQFIQNIKSQLEIRLDIVVQEQQSLIQWDEQYYLQEREKLYNDFKLPLLVIELIPQPPVQQYIEIPLNNQYQYLSSGKLPKQLIQQGLYLKYYRNKQRAYFSGNIEEIQNIDLQDYNFSIMLMLDFKNYEQYQLFNKDFLKFLIQIIENQSPEYNWVQTQLKEFFFNRALEIYEFEEKYKNFKNDAIQFEIIRQNRTRTYAHYNFFSQICQRYLMQDYQKIMRNYENLRVIEIQELYQQYILTFINYFTKQKYEISLTKDQQNALTEYFQCLSKDNIKSLDKFNSTIKLVLESLEYHPPIRDNNPRIGFSIDENIRIEDALFELTKRWSIDGPFYDSNLQKQIIIQYISLNRHYMTLNTSCFLLLKSQQNQYAISYTVIEILFNYLFYLYKVMMKFSKSKDFALTAISPLDGRYADKTKQLQEYFSEYALIKYRVKVEVEWLRFIYDRQMTEKGGHPLNIDIQHLTSIQQNFNIQSAQRVKDIESKINHDVKAVEYYVKEQLEQYQLHDLKEYVHFLCTSEDINNIAYSCMLEESKEKILLAQLDQLITKLQSMAHQYADVPMLSRTHGQVATPTTVGKEIANFTYRIKQQVELLRNLKFEAKLNGAVGNFNAHILAYPNYNWPNLSQEFIEKLQLKYNPYTTQIEPHDSIANFYQYLQLINTILIGFSRDMWQYISINYFGQLSVKGEVGSSTMPHKVNPIDFENCEGNLGLANSLAQHFITKLPISRYQRDLSDSTVMRNHGICLGYSLVGYQSLLKGLSRVQPNIQVIEEDLDNHWEVLAEPIQQVMRRYGHENPYEKLKEITRGQKINKESLRAFINTLELPQNVKQQLLNLEPKHYVGNAGQMAKLI
ncbi:hypothetical protein pb186bvf_005382 [Paramecium bursaria]